MGFPRLNRVWGRYRFGVARTFEMLEVPAQTSSNAQRSLLKVTFVRLYMSLVSFGYLRGAQIANQE